MARPQRGQIDINVGTSRHIARRTLWAHSTTSLAFMPLSTSTPMELHMVKLGFLARLEAKPGKEEEVATFLEAAQEMARQEASTITWYAFRISHSSFGVFDTFNDEAGRQKHMTGPIAQALMAKASELLSSGPSIAPVDLIGSKH